MKKISFLLLFALLLSLLAGCSTSNEDISADDLKKAQAIAVVDTNGTTLQTITDNAAIENFVATLDIDHWELADLPENAEPIGSFGFSEEKTIHFGETDTDGNLYDVAELILYDTPNISITLLGFDFDFAIPETAYETLSAYFV